jgi:hypothetical protein
MDWLLPGNAGLDDVAMTFSLDADRQGAFLRRSCGAGVRLE